MKQQGGFTNEVQHVEFLSPVAGKLASPTAYCFMIGAAVKGGPASAGCKSAPLTAAPIMKERRHAKTGSGVLRSA